MNLLSRISREPITHFLLIGALLFGVFAIVSKDEETLQEAHVFSVSEPEVIQLVAQFRQTWRRAPTADELDGMIHGYIREEVLVREALSLSMDISDPVIRRRLAQKMEFLIASSAAALVPSDEELEAHYEANIEAYSTGMQMALEQIYLGTAPSPREVRDVIAALASGVDPQELGQQTLLPQSLDMSSRQAVANTFGRGFFDALRDIKTGEWRGPIQSGYGVHLVRVTDRVAPSIMPLGAVRAKVEADWRAAAAEDLKMSVFAELEAQYQITTPLRENLNGLLQ